MKTCAVLDTRCEKLVIENGLVPDVPLMSTKDLARGKWNGHKVTLQSKPHSQPRKRTQI